MTESTNPNTEKVEAQPQAAAQSEVVNPATEPAQEEAFDQQRAMTTIKAQREEAKQLRQQLKELDQLRAEKAKRAEAEMTEAQRLQKQADELAAKNAKLESKLLRSEVIAEVNLPSIFADRLQGTTKEELLEDAKKLAELLPKQPTTKTAPTLNATNPANGLQPETEAQMRARVFGQSRNPFDLNAIKEGGGGVIWNTKPD